MTYPGIQSRRKRDEAAATLRRCRQMRDAARVELSFHPAFSLKRQLASLDAAIAQARAEGFREALDLWGGE